MIMLEPERNGDSIKNQPSEEQSLPADQKDFKIPVHRNAKICNRREIPPEVENSSFSAASKFKTNVTRDSNCSDRSPAIDSSSARNDGTREAECCRLSERPDPSSGAIPKLYSNLQISDRSTSCRPKEHKKTLEKSWSELQDSFEDTDGHERRASISDPFFLNYSVKDLDRSFDLHADEYTASNNYVSNLTSYLRGERIPRNDNLVSAFADQKRSIYDSGRLQRQNDFEKNSFFTPNKFAPSRRPMGHPGKFGTESRTVNSSGFQEYYGPRNDFANNIGGVPAGYDVHDSSPRPNPRLKVSEANDERFRLQELERRTKLFFEKIIKNRDAPSQFPGPSPPPTTGDLFPTPSPGSDSSNLMYEFSEAPSEFDAQFKSKMLDFVNSTNSMLRQTRYLNIPMTPEPLIPSADSWTSSSSNDSQASYGLAAQETSNIIGESDLKNPKSQTTNVISSTVPSTGAADIFEQKQNIISETLAPTQRAPQLSNTVPHFKYSVDSPETDVILSSSFTSNKTAGNLKQNDSMVQPTEAVAEESWVAVGDSATLTSPTSHKPNATTSESFTISEDNNESSLTEQASDFVAPSIEDSNLLKPESEPPKRRASIVTCDSVLSEEHPSPDPVKIIVLGDDGVGKTALIVRLVTGRFIGDYDRTLAAVYSYNLPLEGYEEQIQLMDTGGQAFDESYVRWSDAVLMVFSVTSRKSFAVVGDILQKLAGGPAQDQHLEPQIDDSSEPGQAKASEEGNRPSQLHQKCQLPANQSVRQKTEESFSEMSSGEPISKTEERRPLKMHAEATDTRKLENSYSKTNDESDNSPVINSGEPCKMKEPEEDFCHKFSSEKTFVRPQANDDDSRKFSGEVVSTPSSGEKQSKSVNVRNNKSELSLQDVENSGSVQNTINLSETNEVNDEKLIIQAKKALYIDETEHITKQNQVDDKPNDQAESTEDNFTAKNSFFREVTSDNATESPDEVQVPNNAPKELRASSPKLNPLNDSRKSILILGNKNDLTHRREVKDHEGESLASVHRCLYAETAASAPWEEVALPFMELYNQVMARRTAKRLHSSCHQEQ